MSIDAVLLTCEHASAHVPALYASLFASTAAQAALRSHRGVDIGALALARALGKHLGVPVIHGVATRLLVDLNRSRGHRELFSPFTAALTHDERQRILHRYYTPYRQRVHAALAQRAKRGQRTLHLSVHSFTPSLHGQMREADVAWLYDPRRTGERALCARWQQALTQAEPALRLRRNYPYRGRADGLTSAMRKAFAQRDYLGVELEINQTSLTGPAATRRMVTRAIVQSLDAVLRRPQIT